MTSTSEVLNTAADLIEQRGWGTGSWSVDSGPLCIEGAIAAAMGITVKLDAVANYCPANRAVREYLGDAPFIWNDRLYHERVIALIDERDRRALPDLQAQATAEGQARVVEVLRATAAIEQAREAQMADDMIALLASPAATREPQSRATWSPPVPLVEVV